MFNIKKKLVCLLSIMEEKLISHYDHYSSILNIFSARFGSEMERMNSETPLKSKALELKKSNQVLKSFIFLTPHNLQGSASKTTLFSEPLVENQELKECFMRMQIQNSVCKTVRVH
jgi:hypothetical protein